MSLFPDNFTYDERSREMKERMESFYRQAISVNQLWWTEAEIDTRFETGDQTLWNAYYAGLTAKQRKLFFFNRIRPIVSMISGCQRRNRKSTIITPVENADEETADQFSKILIWVNQQENVLETISEAFHGALVTGLNLLQLWIDYRQDPISGNIKVNNCPYNSFLIDPFFKNADLSDCTALWKRSFISKRECMSLLPESSQDIVNLSPKGGSMDKFYYLPENYYFGQNDLLTYDEFYYKAYRKQRMLVDTKTGETQEWRFEDEAALKQYLQTYPEVIITESEIPTVRLAIVVQGQNVYDGPNPLGIDEYPFVPVFGYYNPQIINYSCRIQGIVRGLRDTQYTYNRRKAIELDILESQINSGFIFKENALVDPGDVFMFGQGKGIAIKQNAQITDIQQIIPPAIPPTTLEVSRSLGDEFYKISGANEELMGSATDDKAGILSMLRQGAGLTTLQPLFDNLDRSQKILGKRMLSAVQNNFATGKVKRILNQEPTQQFYNRNFGVYDAAVEEGLNTTTQRQMQFAQLLQLKEAGVPVPDDVLIQAATIQDKKKLTDALAQAQQQQAQMQQAQMEAQTQEIQARTELAQARAKADTGLGLERLSRIEENKQLAVERQAAAQKDEQEALLNMVKALKEIEDIDISQLERLVTLANVLKQESKPEQSVKGKV